MTRTLLLFPLAISLATSSVCRGDVVPFSIDPSRSSLSIDESTANFFGSLTPGVETVAGAFDAALDGVLQVDVEATSLQIVAGSTLLPVDSGSPIPGSGGASFAVTYPDLFGPNAPFLIATRGVTYSVEDGSTRSLSGTAVGAPASTAVGLVSGVADLSTGNPPQTDFSILGIAGSNVDLGAGTYEVNGIVATLTLPVSFDIDVPALISTSTTYSGTIVATGVIPEPGSLAILSAAAAVGLFRRRERA